MKKAGGLAFLCLAGLLALPPLHTYPNLHPTPNPAPPRGLLPRSFINVCSPIVGVPLAPFALGEPEPVCAGQGWCCCMPAALPMCCLLVMIRRHARLADCSLADHRTWPLPWLTGTLLGCLPNNAVAVNAGAHLSDLQSLGDLYSPRLLLLGAAVGAVAMAPILLQRRAERQAAAAAASQHDAKKES